MLLSMLTQSVLFKLSFELTSRILTNIAEPVKFIGEGEYNLNSLKEIVVTDDFLGLDKEDRKCQNDEPHENCTTRQYRNTFLRECGCLPFSMRLFKTVTFHKLPKVLYILFYMYSSVVKSPS